MAGQVLAPWLHALPMSLRSLFFLLFRLFHVMSKAFPYLLESSLGLFIMSLIFCLWFCYGLWSFALTCLARVAYQLQWGTKVKEKVKVKENQS